MRQHTLTSDAAAEVLGVSLDVDKVTLRRAYLEKLKAHPPDRDPAMFERVRDAYELLSDPKSQAHRVLFPYDSKRLMGSTLDGTRRKRGFVGVERWLAAMKGK